MFYVSNVFVMLTVNINIKSNFAFLRNVQIICCVQSDNAMSSHSHSRGHCKFDIVFPNMIASFQAIATVYKNACDCFFIQDGGNIYEEAIICPSGGVRIIPFYPMSHQ